MSALTGFPGLDGVVVLGAAPHGLVSDVGTQVVTLLGTVMIVMTSDDNGKDCLALSAMRNMACTRVNNPSQSFTEPFKDLC